MDPSELGELRKKLMGEKREQEEGIKKVQEKITAIDLVLGMLIENDGGTKEGGKPAEVQNTRFRRLKLTPAILKCISEPVRWWTPSEIKRALIAGGLKTKAKELYNSIVSALQRLVDKGVILAEQQEKGKKYKLKEEGDAKPGNPAEIKQ